MKNLDLDNINYKIEQLIAELYTTFSQYKIQEVRGVCTSCCLTGDSPEQIKKAPVNQVSTQAIFDYLDSAENNPYHFLEEKGEIPKTMVMEIKYLLPRMIELFNKDAYIRHSIELIFDKLYLDTPQLWQDKEIELIKCFAKLHLQKTAIENDLSKYFYLDEFILMWYLAGLRDIDFLFKTWEGITGHPKAIIDYVNLLLYKFHNRTGKYNNAFSPDDFSIKIEQWAKADNTIQLFKEKVYLSLDSIDNLTQAEIFYYEYLLDFV
ncbi:hypothetical protein [Psychrobacter sp. I-STPA6b]|uniref:hypothetical protein n=1 Tax=Psychrobacter sp. I-STPA6b TaxID=2585718 RepID=UPI001D0CC416|nr:hypothetical protein [Psychrobacter sp. I-STPA6b]